MPDQPNTEPRGCAGGDHDSSPRGEVGPGAGGGTARPVPETTAAAGGSRDQRRTRPEPLIIRARAALQRAVTEEYATGISVAAIAQNHECSRRLVCELLWDNGVTLRPDRSRRTGTYASRQDDTSGMDPAELTDLGTALRHFYLTGIPLRALSHLARCSDEVVRRALAAVGVNIHALLLTPSGRSIAPEEIAALGRVLWPHFLGGSGIADLAAPIGAHIAPLIRQGLAQLAQTTTEINPVLRDSRGHDPGTRT